MPLNRRESLCLYDYYGYAPFWGYDYGVRINLKDKRYSPAMSTGLLRPLPGSAPTELRDPQQDRLWERDLDTLFGTRSEALPASPTNTPASAHRD